MNEKIYNGPVFSGFVVGNHGLVTAFNGFSRVTIGIVCFNATGTDPEFHQNTGAHRISESNLAEIMELAAAKKKEIYNA